MFFAMADILDTSHDLFFSSLDDETLVQQIL